MATHKQAVDGTLKPIVWALDPFIEDRSLIRHAGQTLRRLTEHTGAPIEPVYVLSPDELNLYADRMEDYLDLYRSTAVRVVDGTVKRLRLPNLVPSKVLLQRETNTKACVKTLVNHAEEAGAEMIVVSTHGRKGISRAIMGSFSETLLLSTKIPVFSINPNTHAPRKLGKVLFPSNLNASALPVFLRAVAMAKDLRADLTLYYRINPFVEPLLSTSIEMIGGTWATARLYHEQELERARQTAAEWAVMARASDVNCEIRVEESRLTIGDAILGLIKREKFDLVAMASESELLASVLLGSVCRQVLRQAPCPVWLLHAKRDSEADDQDRRGREPEAIPPGLEDLAV
ncbi:MAG: universal stress protein [Bacteriovoracia bacterium]